MPVSPEVLNDDLKELKADIHRLDIGLAELRQEARGAIALAKWAGTIALTTFLTSGVGAIIWGASLTAKVYGMEARTGEKFQEVGTRFDKLEARIDKLETRIDARFDKMEARIDKLEAQVIALDGKFDSRFDKLEVSIARALGQARLEAPAVPRP